jgi:ABC-type maltose transport system permease subunit
MKNKKTVSLLVICAMFMVINLPQYVSAQKLSRQTAETNAQKSNAPENQKEANFRNIFASELARSKAQDSNTTIDFKAIEKAQYKKQTTKGNNWDKRTTVALVVFTVAVTVLVVLVAKYGKVPKCSEIYCPTGETCPCDE